MSNKWGVALAITCWAIAGALGLFNLIEMALMLTGEDGYMSFRGGKGVIVVGELVDLVWQSGLFSVAGFTFFKLRRGD